MLSRFSHVWLFVILWTVACEAPLSMGFCRQECWKWVAMNPSRGSSWSRDWTRESSAAPALQEDSTTEPPVKPLTWHMDAPFETTCPSLLCTKSLTGCKQGWCVQLLGPSLKRKQFTLYFLFPRLRGIHLDTVVVSQLWLCGRGQYPTGENKNIGGSLEDHQAHNTGLLSVGLSQEWEINFLL